MSDPRRRFDLVISDIDGCLAPEGPQAFDEPALHAIAEHNRAAIREGDRPMVTVCTGRPVPFAEALCRLLQNVTVPCVAEAGVWVFDPGQNEFQMDPAISDSDLDAVTEAAVHLRKTYASRGFSIQPGKSASISLYHPDSRLVPEVVPEIRETAQRRGWPLRITATWRYVNCELAHVNKASGIRRLLEASPIARERLVGIGDTLGDRAIAEAVGWFACPANADPALKASAAYVSPYPEAQGTLDILGRVIG